MELQVSHSFCAKISQEGILWREAKGNRRNSADAVQLEKSEDRRSRGVSKSCTYAFENPAQSGDIEFHGILEGKKQLDDL